MEHIDPALLQRLDALAAKLNVTAQYLWAVMLRQAHIEAATDLVWASISLTIALACGYFLLRVARMALANTWDSEDYLLKALVAGLVTLLAVVFFCINLQNAITPLLNPEFWALQQLLK